MKNILRARLQGERVTLTRGFTLALSHFHFVSSSRVYKAARVTRVGGLPHLRARFILTGGVTLSLVNTPGTVKPPTRVNFLIVSRPFECNRALSCPGM